MGWVSGRYAERRNLAGVVEWQTRSTQNALLERACGFKSRPRHRTSALDLRKSDLGPLYPLTGENRAVGESVGDWYGGRHGEVVALSAFPSLGAQDVGLHLRFDPFGDAGQVHAVYQPAQALAQGVGLAVAGGEVVHES